jgi:hypothetical protein
MSIQHPDRFTHIDHLGAVACDMETFDDGHELHPIIRRAALATASHWVDAVVVSSSADGRIRLASFDDATVVERWHHADLTGVLAPGTPVAFHSVYAALAVGERLVSVRAA